MHHLPHALLHVAHARQLLTLAGLAIENLEIHYRRAQDDGGVAAYRLHGPDAEGNPVDTLGYARWGSAERIAAIADKWLQRARPCAWGAGVRPLPGLDALLFVFPNDRNLKALPKVASITELKRTLAPLPPFEPAGYRIREKRATLDVLRYKPEQRCILRAQLEARNESNGDTRAHDLIVRVFADARGATLLHTLEAWRDAGAAHVLPEPLGVLEDGQVYVERSVPGETMRAAIRTGRIAPERFADALATLHAARPAFEARRTPVQRLELLHRITAALAEAGVPGVKALLARLETACPAHAGESPVHADLHARQVLVHDGAPAFVDLERAALGDPLDDLGSLTGHLRWEHATLGADGAAAAAFAGAVTAAYAARTTPRPVRDLAFYEAAALLEIAELPVRRRLDDSAALAGKAVALAAASLDAAERA